MTYLHIPSVDEIRTYIHKLSDKKKLLLKYNLKCDQNNRNVPYFFINIYKNKDSQHIINNYMKK